jgi:hypothetical protein
MTPYPLVASRDNIGALDHQDYGLFRSAGAMTHTFGNYEAMPRSKIDNAILEIDQEMSVQNEKEFVNIFVFVPVIFALHHSHPDDGVIHLAKRLVIPFVGAGIGQLLHIDELKRPVQNVHVSFVRRILLGLIGVHD